MQRETDLYSRRYRGKRCSPVAARFLLRDGLKPESASR
jgi:hypothetical protein